MRSLSGRRGQRLQSDTDKIIDVGWWWRRDNCSTALDTSDYVLNAVDQALPGSKKSALQERCDDLKRSARTLVQHEALRRQTGLMATRASAAVRFLAIVPTRPRLCDP